MPADDIVLSVRQISGYPPVSMAPPGSTLVLQTRGLGSPYASITPADLVSTALANMPGNLYAAGRVAAGSIASPCAIFDSLSAQKASVAGVPVATKADISAILTNSVFSFNMRFGHVMLELQDIVCAGGAPIRSPRFRGEPRAPTPAAWSNTTRLATTEFVHRNSVLYINDLLSTHPFVFTFNGRSGDIVLTPEDLAGVEAAFLESPAFTGVPTAPTPPPGSADDTLATTSFVTQAVAVGVSNGLVGYAPLTNPQFVGQPTAPTAPPGNNTGQLATTAFVMAAVAASTAGVASFNGRTGVVDLEAADITGAGGALLASPNFTGTPQAPTAPPGSTSSQIATCAWVANEIGSSTVGVMSFNGREGVVVLNTSDITGAGGAPAASPAFTGTPTAPTATTGTNTTQLATCAFVAQAIMQTGVASFNGRTGNVTLAANDISAAGGLINPSVALTGTPTAPTATGGTNTTQIATTAFVAAAISGAAVVSSFNTRVGAVSLTAADVTGVGGVLASQTINAVRTRSFTTSGSFTYTPSPGLICCVIECVGGGGGGNFVAATAAGTFSVSSGGGSGGYSRRLATAAQVGASQPVTVGGAGTGGFPGQGALAGGSTSVGSLCLANGGAPGYNVSAQTYDSCVAGGAGGASAGAVGDFVAAGSPGGMGVGLVGGVTGGPGGSSYFGGGAPSIGTGIGYANGAAGTSGGGGGGTASVGGNGPFNGGPGGMGVVVITEFCNQ